MQRPRINRAQYDAARAEGYSDAEIRAEYDVEETATAQTAAAQTPETSAEDAAYQRASRYAKSYGMIDNALRAATFGFGDEIRSAAGAIKDAVTGAGPLGASYRGRMRAEQEGMDRFARETPGQSIASSLVGGAVTGLGGAAGTAARATAGQALRSAAAQGAIYGGVAGAGEARGGAAERLIGAGRGAALGGVFGAALQGAANRIGRAFGRDAGMRADDKIIERLQQSGMTLDDADRSARAAMAAGKPAALVDVGGPSLAELGRDATAFPSRGSQKLREFVTQRMVDQPERLASDLATTGRVTRVSSTQEAVQTLAQEREKLAKPMYDAVRNVAVSDGRLGALFDLPDFQKAYQIAQRVAARRAAAGEGMPLPPYAPGQPMTLGTLDQVKRALDDVIFVGKRSPLDAGGMGPTELSSLRKARDVLVLVGDDATRDPRSGKSAYASARAMFEGPTRLMEALDEAGASFLSPKTTAADVRMTLANMGSAEREAYKAGALDHIANKLATQREGRDVAATLNSPAVARKLEQLFDSPEDYAAWRERFTMELGFGRTRNTVAVGSRTTPMALGADDIGRDPGVAMAGVQSLASGSPMPIMSAMARRLLAARNGVVRQSTASAIADRLSAGTENPDDLVRAIQSLMQRQRTPAYVVRRGAARTAGVAAGSLTGR